MAFAVTGAARLPLFPTQRAGVLTTRQTSLNASDRSVAPPTGLLTPRLDPGRSPRSRQPATGPTDSYPDRTFPGRRRRAYVGSATQTAPPTLGTPCSGRRPSVRLGRRHALARLRLRPSALGRLVVSSLIRSDSACSIARSAMPTNVAIVRARSVVPSSVSASTAATWPSITPSTSPVVASRISPDTSGVPRLRSTPAARARRACSRLAAHWRSGFL
jgi:hypothetical protein